MISELRSRAGRTLRLRLAARLWNTLFLAFWAAIISVPLAIALGLARRALPKRLSTRRSPAVALASTSLPEFFIGYLLIYFVAVKMQWLPSVSTVYDGMAFSDRMKAIALPALALTLVVFAQ